MRYKIMVKGAAYKAARTAKLYTAQIYRAVSIKLIITLPDGTPLSGQTVNINGTDMATGPTGQVILTGDMGLTAKLHIIYNVTYIADVDVTYIADTSYTVTLEQHVAAGSVSVGVWNYYSSNFGKKSYTLTIPAVVKIIKITGTGFDGWSDESTDSAYVGTSGKTEQSGNTVIQYGNGSFTKYVGVTAGKSYTLHGRWIKDAVIAWSDEINTHKADVTI